MSDNLTHGSSERKDRSPGTGHGGYLKYDEGCPVAGAIEAGEIWDGGACPECGATDSAEGCITWVPYDSTSGGSSAAPSAGGNAGGAPVLPHRDKLGSIPSGDLPAPSSAAQAHPEDTCEEGGGRNVVWFAPSDLWNRVMRGGDRGAPDVIGIVCPTCFILRAEAAGVEATGWLVQPEVIHAAI